MGYTWAEHVNFEPRRRISRGPCMDGLSIGV